MDVSQEIRGFKWGVQAGAENDQTPLESTPYAWNTALRSIGGGTATLGTRPGLTIVNTTALTGSFQLIRNYPYYSSGVTNKLALVTSEGKFYFKDGTNAIGSEIVPPANFPYTSGHCFASGDYPISAAIMSNRLFMVNTNGERRSILNETFKMFGMEHLATIASTNVATGSSSMPAETYDVVTTTYDSATGAESSSSPAQSVTLGANERIRVTITPSTSESAQNTHWRVYIRRRTTQSNKFRVLTLENVGGTTIVTDGNIPIATTQVYVDLSASDIANLVLVAPTESENDPPPVTATYLATYGNRLILADGYNIYYSKLNLPDAFPSTNFEPVNSGEGDKITGIHEFADDLLLIFTTNNVWGLFGNDPQTWELKAIDHNVGCTAGNSVTEISRGVMWWSGTQGPVMYDGNSIAKVGLDKLGTDILRDVEGSRLNHIIAGFDPVDQRVLFSYSLLNTASRNDATVPFSVRVNEFEATRWNPMDFSAFGVGYDTDDKLKLFCGNYAGQIFVLDATVSNDGVPSGTVTGTFTPATSSITTITSTGFYTTGAGLTERYAVVKDSDGAIVGRSRISSNSATVLTLATTITGLAAGTPHRFEVGAPDVRVYTKWMDFDKAFVRKRFDNVYVHIRTENNSENLLMGTLLNYNPLLGTLYQGFANTGVSWDADDAIFDSSVWGGAGESKKRFRIVRNAHAVQVALFHCRANKDIVILKIAALARQLGDRYYG